MELAQRTTTLIISNKEMEDVMKEVRSLEDYDLLKEIFSQTIENGIKDESVDFSVYYLAL